MKAVILSVPSFISGRDKFSSLPRSVEPADLVGKNLNVGTQDMGSRLPGSVAHQATSAVTPTAHPVRPPVCNGLGSQTDRLTYFVLSGQVCGFLFFSRGLESTVF